MKSVLVDFCVIETLVVIVPERSLAGTVPCLERALYVCTCLFPFQTESGRATQLFVDNLARIGTKREGPTGLIAWTALQKADNHHVSGFFDRGDDTKVGCSTEELCVPPAECSDFYSSRCKEPTRPSFSQFRFKRALIHGFVLASYSNQCGCVLCCTLRCIYISVSLLNTSSHLPSSGEEIDFLKNEAVLIGRS